MKATAAAIKAAIAAIQSLAAAIAVGGWVAVVVILVICLVALLAAESRDLWSNLLYGDSGEIVAVALSQVGNVGGYIYAGVIPKFAGCTGGFNWFKDRGQWQDNSYEPRPGDLILDLLRN